MDHRRVPDGWASWFLVLAAAVPAAAATHLAWVVLGGSVDDFYGRQDPPATGATLLGIRWSNLWMTFSVPLLLLTGVLPLVVLAAASLAGRPRALVPVGGARSVGSFVAAVTTVLGLAGVAGFTAQLAGVLPVVTWSSPTGSRLDAFAPAAAVALTTTVLGFGATAVLWPRGSVVPDVGAEVEEPVAGTAEETTGTEVGTPLSAVTAAEAPFSAAADRPPCVADADLDLYRRR